MIMVRPKTQPKPRKRIHSWTEVKNAAANHGVSHSNHIRMYKGLFLKNAITPQEAIQVEQNRLARQSLWRDKPEQAKKRAVLTVKLCFQAAEFFKSAGRKKFKRHLLSESEAKTMMNGLRKKLAAREYFGSLPRIGRDGYVAVYEHNGIPIAVKYTGKNVSEGANPAELKKSLELYRAETRSGKIIRADGQPVQEKHSRLIMPKVYGTAVNGKYLAMEYMEGIDIATASKLPDTEARLSFERAYNEAQLNIGALQKNGLLKPLKTPQHWDMTVLGNTNPLHPAQGKWIFALPFDAY